jgi:hypothetical protein
MNRVSAGLLLALVACLASGTLVGSATPATLSEAERCAGKAAATQIQPQEGLVQGYRSQFKPRMLT